MRGIICGHIHTAADKEINGVHYLNSGDWVENRSAIVEHLDRRIEVICYEDFIRIVGATPTRRLSGQPLERHLAPAPR